MRAATKGSAHRIVCVLYVSLYNYAFKNSLLVLTFLFGSGRNNRKKKATMIRIATTSAVFLVHCFEFRLSVCFSLCLFFGREFLFCHTFSLL